MVSVKQSECEYPHLKSNSAEQCKCHQMLPIGTRAHLYKFGSPTIGNDSRHWLQSSPEEGQSSLDVFLLSQWEDRSWKDQLAYDVTMSEVKILTGEKQLIAQLNEKWNPKFLAEFGKKALPSFCPFEPSYVKTLRKDLLFCIASGEYECSQVVLSAMLPKDGILVLINVNPVEYGHVFLVPYGIHQRPYFLDNRTLLFVTQIAAELNSSSFYISYESNVSTHSDQTYFQAAYFANSFPVEHLPTVNIYNEGANKAISIYALADYPLKALVFMSENFGILVGVVADICSILRKDESKRFNLLISNCGKKMFLFPQVRHQDSGDNLSTWECGGYFIYKTKSEFDNASEVELSKRMASASLGNEEFEALKQLCCSIALHADSL